MNTTVNMSYPVAQRGLSLLELLVSMLIGLIILAGVIQVFEGNYRTSRYQDALAVVQENGRFALTVLTRDLRQAGYVGCKSGYKLVRNALDVADPDGLSNSLRYGIEAWEAEGTQGFGLGSPPTGFPFYIEGTAPQATNSGAWVDSMGATPDFVLQALPGSDIIRLSGGYGAVATVTNISSNDIAAAQVEVDSAAGFSANQLVVRNECRPETPVVMQVCSVVGNTLNLFGACSVGNRAADPDDPSSMFAVMADQDPGERLSMYSEMVVVDSRIYFVGLGAGNVPSLFRSVLVNGAPGDPQELVEGIENIQYLFGINTHEEAGPPTMYVPPSGLPDYAGAAFEDSEMQASTVRVFLMAVSAEDNLVRAEPGALSYRFMGETYDQVPDGRIRQIFSRTVTVRNNASLE